MKKKLLSVLLALAMVLTLLPTAAFATGIGGDGGDGQTGDTKVTVSVSGLSLGDEDTLSWTITVDKAASDDTEGSEKDDLNGAGAPSAVALMSLEGNGEDQNGQLEDQADPDPIASITASKVETPEDSSGGDTGGEPEKTLLGSYTAPAGAAGGDDDEDYEDDATNGAGASFSLFSVNGEGTETAATINVVPSDTEGDYPLIYACSIEETALEGTENIELVITAAEGFKIVAAAEGDDSKIGDDGTTYTYTETLGDEGKKEDPTTPEGDEFTVTFDPNGGTEANEKDLDPQTVQKDGNVTKPDDPTRAGCTLKAWVDEDGKEWDFDNDKVEKNMKLTAKWVTTYKVTYVLGGGQYDDSQTTIAAEEFTEKEPDTEVELTLENIQETLTKDGFKFTGWEVSPNTATLDLQNKKLTVSADAAPGTQYTLTAQWKELDTYTVVYDLADGKYGDDNATTITQETFKADSSEENTFTLENLDPTKDPTRDDHEFVDWTVEPSTVKLTSDEGSYKLTVPAGTTGTITLTAKWAAITTYKVSYDLNGGKEEASFGDETFPNKRVGEQVALPLENISPTKEPTQEDETQLFTGWSTPTGTTLSEVDRSNGGSKDKYDLIVSPEAAVENAEFKLTATWSTAASAEITHNIVYLSNGGSGSQTTGDKTIKIEIGEASSDAIELPENEFTPPADKAQKFSGWALAKDAAGTPAGEEGIPGLFLEKSGDKQTLKVSTAFNETTAGTIYLIAQWEDEPAIAHTLTYKSNDANDRAESVPAEVPEGELSFVIESLPKNVFEPVTGTVFDKWVLSSNGTDAVDDGTVITGVTLATTGDGQKLTIDRTCAEGTTIYLLATWKTITQGTTQYTITFAPGTGASGSMEDVKVTKATSGDTEYTLPTSTTFTAPSGKEFDKWTVSPATVRISDDGKTLIIPASVAVTETITLTATWKTITQGTTQYTINFAANGGGGSMESKTVAKAESGNTTYTIPACTFTAPSGKVFDTWTVSPTTVTISADGKTLTIPESVAVTETITLTANWKDAPAYTITFAPGEGTGGPMENGKVIKAASGATTYDIPECAFTATGKVFDKWTVTPADADITISGSTLTIPARVEAPATITLTATWKDKPADADTSTTVEIGSENKETGTGADGKKETSASVTKEDMSRAIENAIEEAASSGNPAEIPSVTIPVVESNTGNVERGTATIPTDSLKKAAGVKEDGSVDPDAKTVSIVTEVDKVGTVELPAKALQKILEVIKTAEDEGTDVVIPTVDVVVQTEKVPANYPTRPAEVEKKGFDASVLILIGGEKEEVDWGTGADLGIGVKFYLGTVDEDNNPINSSSVKLYYVDDKTPTSPEDVNGTHGSDGYIKATLKHLSTYVAEYTVTTDEGDPAPDPDTGGASAGGGATDKSDKTDSSTGSVSSRPTTTGGSSGGSSGGYGGSSGSAMGGGKSAGSTGSGSILVPAPSGGSTGGVGGFTDVPYGHSFATEIAWAQSNGVLGGYADGSFRPSANTTRQALWMVLARLSGTYPSNMAEARSWAINAGISDGTNGEGNMSRQQFITMLYRYAQTQGYALTGSTDLGSFSDNGVVADYAKEAIAWGVANGVITGTTDGRLNPEGTATRAHFAAFVYRFSNLNLAPAASGTEGDVG